MKAVAPLKLSKVYKPSALNELKLRKYLHDSGRHTTRNKTNNS